MEENLQKLLRIIEIIPTNEQLLALKYLLEDVYMDGYEECEKTYSRECW